MRQFKQKPDAPVDNIVLSAEARREQIALQASTKRMRAERLEIDAENRALGALIERQERLAAHLLDVL
jgi:hypothetical protein